jgi:hypothetical protein
MFLGGKGTLFVYIKSINQTIDRDSGLYSSKFPHIEGNTFTTESFYSRIFSST